MQLPDPGLVNFYRLAENRIVYIDADIDESVLELQKMIFSWNLEDKDMGLQTENRQPIVLIIDSPGGMLDETMSICSTIKLSKTPIYTVNVAQAYSGAALIFMSGHRRFVFPYAKTMIHSGGTTGIGGTFEQTEAAQKLYRKQIAEMGDYILANSKIEQKVFKRNQAKDWYFTAQEAVDYGLADEVIAELDSIL